MFFGSTCLVRERVRVTPQNQRHQRPAVVMPHVASGPTKKLHLNTSQRWLPTANKLCLRKRKYLSAPPDGAGETGRIWTVDKLSEFFDTALASIGRIYTEEWSWWKVANGTGRWVNGLKSWMPQRQPEGLSIVFLFLFSLLIFLPQQPVQGISLSDFFNMLKKGCQRGSTHRDTRQKLGPHALISGEIHQWRTVGLACQGPLIFRESWFIIQQNRWFALNTCDCFRNSGNLIKNG